MTKVSPPVRTSVRRLVEQARRLQRVLRREAAGGAAISLPAQLHLRSGARARRGQRRHAVVGTPQGERDRSDDSAGGLRLM